VEVSEFENKLMPILLVDKTPENFKGFSNLLQNESIELECVSSGFEAIKLLEKRNDFGLILMDFNLIEMDVFETTSNIKSNIKTKHVPIIYINVVENDNSWMNLKHGKGANDKFSISTDFKEIDYKLNTHIANYRHNLDVHLNLNNVTEENRNLKLSNEVLVARKNNLERFTSIIAHDIKAPVRRIGQVTKTLQTEIGDKLVDDQVMLMEFITDSANKLTSLVNDILGYCQSTTKAISFQEVNTSELINDVLRTIRPHKSIKIATNLDDLANFNSSPIAIRQIFENLITNAIKYGKQPNKELTIEIVGHIDEENAMVEFYVKDNGPGIEERYHEKIFELMNTAGQTGPESSGIGLGIVKIMVERLKGDIFLESVIGEGSTFFFKIKNFPTTAN
jgi:signal transduction histidine kinase